VIEVFAIQTKKTNW